MTIKKAYFFPTEARDDVLKAHGANAISATTFNSFAAISIGEVNRLCLAYPSFVRPVLATRFSDFIPYGKWTARDQRNAPHIKLIDQDECQRIIRFVHDLIRAPESFTIFINCSGGIARSSAVARFIHFANQNSDEPDGLRKSIESPNKMVYDMLLTEWNAALHGIVNAR